MIDEVVLGHRDKVFTGYYYLVNGSPVVCKVPDRKYLHVEEWTKLLEASGVAVPITIQKCDVYKRGLK